MRSRAGDVLIRGLIAAGVVAVTLLPGAGTGAWGEAGARNPVGGESDQGGGESGNPVGGESGNPVGGESDQGERVLFRFADERITESSGLALSPSHDDVYYTHNDSSAGPVFFAVGGDGRTRATFTLRGADARDWEAMAASKDPKTGRGVLWFADIGDNFEGAWPDISVYKVQEPASLRDATLPAVRYRFRYEDGGHNAEGLMVHPRTGRLHIVSKEFSGSIYQAPRRLRADRVNILRRIGPAPVMATDAAYAPDGSSFVVRTYFSATVYSAPGEQLAKVDMPQLEQAESIAYTADGTALLTGTEGSRSPVYRVPLPEEVLRAAAPEPTPAASGTASEAPGGGAEGSGERVEAEPAQDDAGVPFSAVALWLAVAVGATGVIVFIARRAR
ncbi:hypothetical protein ACFFMN_29065 [Planobispora siamensis]|uniref:Uncharacterized protein n=1 Tax=Planobispora siamensis TaxID=936338 RepID=A0A8J3SGS5_9ACTN|nr:hypothetical protein [Planobispora siamensis]GIH91764.1 hypothetical protein Psi01_23940 [Planobispora siamensis]